MEAHEDGHKDLIEEDCTYSVLGALFDGRKWYFQCVRCVVRLFVDVCGRFLVVEVV